MNSAGLHYTYKWLPDMEGFCFQCWWYCCSVPLLPPKVLSPKIPMGEEGWLSFKHSTTSLTRCIRHRLHGNHRDWSTAALAQLSSFLFMLIYPLFILLSRAGTPPFTKADYQSGWGSLFCWSTLFSHCDLVLLSRTSLLSVLSPDWVALS